MSIGAHAMLIAASAQGSGSGSGGDGSGLFGAFDQDPNAERLFLSCSLRQPNAADYPHSPSPDATR